jgi:PAS domain S-box-containing protein
MDDARKTKRQLLSELETLRLQVEQLQEREVVRRQPEKNEWRNASDGNSVVTPSEQERRYRHMVEHSLGLICIHDFGGNLLYVNPAAARGLGYSLEEIITKNLREIVTPDARPLFPLYLERIRQSPADRGLMHVQTKAGELRIWRYQNSWYEEEGRPLYVVGCAQDVTEQSRLERELRRSEARYARATEAGKVGVWDWDLKNGRMYCDPYLRSLTGLTEEELQQHPERWDECLHPDDVPAVLAAQEEYLNGKVPHYEAEHRLRLKDGSRRWYLCRATVERDKNGVPVRMIGTDTDITERKEMEEKLRKAHDGLELQVQERTAELAQANAALRESEEKYRGILENANDIIATFSIDGVITSVNRAAEVVLGWSRSELVGRHLSNFTSPSSAAMVAERTRQFFAGEKLTANVEAEVQCKDGSVIVFECRTRSIRDREGYPVGFQIIFRDITTRRQAEEKLKQAKEAAEAADREKSEFLSTMSHELRTPLNIILGYGELLLTQDFGVLTQEQSEAVKKIDKNARSLFELIDGVLNFNRLEAGRMPVEMTEVRLGDLFREVEKETLGLRELSDLMYFWRVEEGLPPLLTDAGKLKVILKNLLGNAAKFTKTGSVTVTARRAGDALMLSVADTGIGIAPEQRELIFEAFQKVDDTSMRRSDGFGLGLHIVKRLLDLLGGEIEVESEVGQGSTFYVRLPIVRTDGGLGEQSTRSASSGK